MLSKREYNNKLNKMRNWKRKHLEMENYNFVHIYRNIFTLYYFRRTNLNEEVTLLTTGRQ